MKNVRVKSREIKDVLEHILTDCDISLDYSETIEIIGDIETLDVNKVSVKFCDSISTKKYWLHIFPLKDSEILAAFYFNNVSKIISTPNIAEKGFYNDDYFYVVEENVNGTTMQNWIETSDKRQEENIYDDLLVFKNIANNIMLLHKYSFVHGDLSDRNIIVSEKGLVYLIDFETIHQIGSRFRKYWHTMGYAVTEIGKDKEIITEGRDIEYFGKNLSDWKDKNRGRMEIWMEQRVNKIIDYCKNNQSCDIEFVVNEIQKIINVLCMRPLIEFAEKADIYCSIDRRHKEDTRVCSEARNKIRNKKDAELIYYFKSKKNINKWFAVFDDVYRRSPIMFKSQNMNLKTHIKSTFEIRPDLVVYAWPKGGEKEKILLISRCIDKQELLLIFEFSTLGMDRNQFAECINKMVYSRESCSSDRDLVEYYQEIIDYIDELPHERELHERHKYVLEEIQVKLKEAINA